MRFLLDEGLSPRVRDLIAAAGHDVVPALVLANIDQLEGALTEGALVVIGDNPPRIRALPIDRA